MLTVDVQRDSAEDTPSDDDLGRAAEQAIAAAGLDPDSPVELSLRIVDREEMQALNLRYRDRNAPTNVLSFPVDLPDGVSVPLLGDVVVCAPVVHEEADAQGKSRAAHWDHLLIHGVLHLLGFDHQSDDEALEMESLERTALAHLGWPCPYESEPRDSSPTYALPDPEVSARLP